MAFPKRFARLYLVEFFMSWLYVAFTVAIFETLLHILREIKFLSDSYTAKSMLIYLFSDFTNKFTNLAPMTAYLAVFALHWRWMNQGQWMACLAIGLGYFHYFAIRIIQISLSLMIALPLAWFISPLLLSYGVKIREQYIPRVKGIQIEQVYLDKPFVFYPISKNKVFVYDLKSQKVVISPYQHDSALKLKTNLATLDITWDQFFGKGLKIHPFYNKLLVYGQLPDKYLPQMRLSILQDIFFPFLIILALHLAWFRLPPTPSLRHYQFPVFGIFLDCLILYFAMKMLELSYYHLI